MTTLATPPGTVPLWMAAIEAQLSGIELIRRLLDSVHPKVKALDSQWEMDRVLMTPAVPFAWSEETTAATLAASRSIPLDTVLNAWNLDTPAAWWYFEKPLPFRTVNVAEDTGLRGICIGWIYAQAESATLPAGSPISVFEYMLKHGPPMKRNLAVCGWCNGRDTEHLVTPSQTMLWEEGETLGGMLSKTKRWHAELYGPGGKFELSAQVGEDVFMAAAEGMARFILAGLAWLNQKVLVEGAGHIERHRRKAFNRTTGQDLRDVRVVSLRRVDRPKSEGPEPEDKTEWTCQWQVDGHFRNQAVGAGHKDRRLTWVSPYVKGPEGMPLKVPKRKVYVVNR